MFSEIKKQEGRLDVLINNAGVASMNHSRDARQFHRELRQFCRQRLQEFQIPVRVRLVENSMHGKRFKKKRRENVAS